MIELILAVALQCPTQTWVTPELEKHSVPGFGCDSRMFNVIDNVMYAAGEYYWTPITHGQDPKVCKEYNPNECTRAPCGGDANCAKPYLAETAICWVEETDCWESWSDEEMDSIINDGDIGTFPDPVIIRTFVLECSGTINCKWEAGLPADFCCQLLEVIEEEEKQSDNSC